MLPSNLREVSAKTKPQKTEGKRTHYEPAAAVDCAASIAATLQ
jgi:hypothetical protein